MFDKNSLDDAVSPVVAVILMVAVTVILAAVIGSFVLDLGSNVQANPQAGVTFSQDAADHDGDGNQETYVSVQAISMENADSLTVTDGTESRDQTISSTGDSVTMKGEETDATNGYFAGYSATDEITVIGELDGKQAVLQSHTVE